MPSLPSSSFYQSHHLAILIIGNLFKLGHLCRSLFVSTMLIHLLTANSPCQSTIHHTEPCGRTWTQFSNLKTDLNLLFFGALSLAQNNRAKQLPNCRWSTATSIRRPRTRTGTTSTSAAGSAMNPWPAKGRLLWFYKLTLWALRRLTLKEDLSDLRAFHFMGHRSQNNRQLTRINLLICFFQIRSARWPSILC